MLNTKFRGKRLDGEGWVFGYYYTNGTTHFIATSHMYPVEPNTVGQFIGLYDKHGVEIYHGDYVRCVDENTSEASYAFEGHVEFQNGSFMINSGAATHYRWIDYEVEVVDSIHDRPELIAYR